MKINKVFVIKDLSSKVSSIKESVKKLTLATVLSIFSLICVAVTFGYNCYLTTIQTTAINNQINQQRIQNNNLLRQQTVITIASAANDYASQIEDKNFQSNILSKSLDYLNNNLYFTSNSGTNSDSQVPSNKNQHNQSDITYDFEAIKNEIISNSKSVASKEMTTFKRYVIEAFHYDQIVRNNAISKMIDHIDYKNISVYILMMKEVILDESTYPNPGLPDLVYYGSSNCIQVIRSLNAAELNGNDKEALEQLVDTMIKKQIFNNDTRNLEKLNEFIKRIPKKSV